jgi:hypothetical protein
MLRKQKDQNGMAPRQSQTYKYPNEIKSVASVTCHSFIFGADVTHHSLSTGRCAKQVAVVNHQFGRMTTCHAENIASALTRHFDAMLCSLNKKSALLTTEAVY